MKKLTYFDFKVSEIKGTHNDIMTFQYDEIIEKKILSIVVNHLKSLKKFVIYAYFDNQKIFFEDEISTLNLALDKANIFYNQFLKNDK